MDSQIEKFLGEYAERALRGAGFASLTDEQRAETKSKLLDYFSDLIFDTLLQNLTDEQLKELQGFSDLGSEEAQQKIAAMSASIPGFIFILQDRFEKAAEEVGRTGKIPEATVETAPGAV